LQHFSCQKRNIFDKAGIHLSEQYLLTEKGEEVIL